MTEQRILVVDDDDAIRALLRVVLRRRGFIVDVARNGSEALDRFRSFPYRLVVLDLMMPVMSGYDFIALVRAMPRERRPVVLVLTAGGPPANLDPSVVAGTLHKPFDITLLTDTVSACLAALPDEERRSDRVIDLPPARMAKPEPNPN